MAKWLKIRIENEDYREPSTEGTDWDIYQTAYRNEYRNDDTGGL